jgi:hypothetical protein
MKTTNSKTMRRKGMRNKKKKKKKKKKKNSLRGPNRTKRRSGESGAPPRKTTKRRRFAESFPKETPTRMNGVVAPAIVVGRAETLRHPVRFLRELSGGLCQLRGNRQCPSRAASRVGRASQRGR